MQQNHPKPSILEVLCSPSLESYSPSSLPPPPSPPPSSPSTPPHPALSTQHSTQHSTLSTQHSTQHSTLSTQHPSTQHSALSTQHSALNTHSQLNPCETTTILPTAECFALTALYNRTNGDGWITNTNWLSFTDTITPCDWYGVTCANGHVTALNLASNNLSGKLPASLQRFEQLTTLDLHDNQIGGLLPSTLCELVDTVTTADFAYNRINTFSNKLNNCAKQLDPDWVDTQTLNVRQLKVTSFLTDALELSWNTIPYTADGGYYEISYALQNAGPYTVHGQTADKITNTYLLDGLESGYTYFVNIQTVTPAHANQSAEQRSNGVTTVGVTQSAEKILLLMYIAADNDLDPNLLTIGSRVRAGSRFNPNLQVAALIDGSTDGDTQFIEIANGTLTFTNDVFDAWGTNELDTADPATLEWFLSHARQKYPADREVVSLIGHGLAFAPEINWPESETTAAARYAPNAPNTGPIPPLPQGIDLTASDATSRNYISPIDLRHAFEGATNNGADPFDIIFFDQCFQGNLDTLYEVRHAAEVFIASPNYGWLIAAYDRYITQLAPADANSVIAQKIIERYQGALPDRGHPNAIFWITQTQIEEIATAVSNLGDALTAATNAGITNPILNASADSQYVDTTLCGRNQLFTLGQPDELIGAESFAANLQDRFPSGDQFGVHAAAAALETLLTPISRTINTGSPYLAPAKNWNYDNTLTILAPLPRKSPPAFAWRASIYTETMPVEAVWSPVPTVTVTITEPFALAVDGRWDNFLDTWYTEPFTPTIGQWCLYIPPAIRSTDETEAISLTLTLTDNTDLNLQWTPTTDQRVIGYQVLENSPDTIGWTIIETLQADQNTLSQTIQPSAAVSPTISYAFQILAIDAEGQVIEQSNEAAAAPEVKAPPYIYLPLIIRP